MGKPSSTRLPKSRNSEVSVLRGSDQMSGIKKINAPKMDVRNKRKRKRTKNKIKKLFEQMRNASTISIDSSIDSTVVLLDDSTQENIDKSLSRKRKLSDSSLVEQNKCMKTDNAASVINSDDNKPHSSTIDDALNNIAKPDDESDMTVSNNDESDVTVSNNDETVILKNNDKTNETPQCNDVLIVNTVPSSSNIFQKLFAPPMNCSTPIKSRTNSSINNNAETAPNFNVDVTKEINNDSYFTIDLTTETDPNRSSISKTQFNTVIDLDNTQESQDCTFVSISNTSLSMSGDSDVTVIRNNSRKRVNKFVNGIAKLDASEKGRLLELITQKIFSGCKIPEKIKSKTSNLMASVSKATETVESSYIKEVILGEKPSRNSIGSNIYNPRNDRKNKTGLRMIVIDGSNVAMEHSKGRVFSVRGLQICIDYFVKRGHVVKAFVPRFRCKFGKSTEPRLLDDLERQGLVVYTPSREIQGRMITPYDDRYIVQCAAEFDAVIVSGDNYRDLHRENPRWRTVIENRLLPFTWVNDMIMFPRDPLGRNGPTLEAFLRHPSAAPMPSIVL